jgi:FHS family Na+ dependent glucose MFS transporter 1
MDSATTIISHQAARAAKTKRISQTSAYFAAFVALGLTTASLGPTLPRLAGQTHARLSEISFLFTARSLGFLLGAFRGGKLYDRLSGRVLMTGALVLMASVMALIPLSPSLLVLIVTMIVLGAAESLLDVGGNTLLVWTHGERVGPYMNGLHFFYGVGAFLSPIIIAETLSLSGDVSLAYRALALLVLLVAGWMLRTHSPAMRATSKDSSAEHTDMRLVLLIALFFFLYLGAEVSFGGWIYTYVVSLKLSNATRAAYLTSAFWGSLALGRLISIPLAARFRPRTLLLCGLTGCLLSIGVILLWSGSLPAIWLGTFGAGLSMSSIFPSTLSWAERRMKITGQVTGWLLVGASAGGMFLPWLIGQLFESAGPRTTMLIIICDLLAAVFVFVALTRYSFRPVAKRA